MKRSHILFMRQSGNFLSRFQTTIIFFGDVIKKFSIRN
ncbi:hypothetical protein LEP1GSC125_2745 [Leptospira mayottensis 200901122]|uniref:Uncharacterized protein n=1 Tax=Leptospira mayottensis 200901122 TaxID=1193010 RepID=A0AA87MRV3_9LEPT|nr:hypothetical protein LEP1GSC125_2745 [Leptospira mayottensis 200901122]